MRNIKGTDASILPLLECTSIAMSCFEETFPFATTYEHLHQQQTTPLLAAWQQSFLHKQPPPDTEKTISTSPSFISTSTNEFVPIRVTPLQTASPSSVTSTPMSSLEQSGNGISEAGLNQQTLLRRVSTESSSTFQFGSLPSVDLSGSSPSLTQLSNLDNLSRDQ